MEDRIQCGADTAGPDAGWGPLLGAAAAQGIEGPGWWTPSPVGPQTSHVTSLGLVALSVNGDNTSCLEGSGQKDQNSSTDSFRHHSD